MAKLMLALLALAPLLLIPKTRNVAADRNVESRHARAVRELARAMCEADAPAPLRHRAQGHLRLVAANG